MRTLLFKISLLSVLLGCAVLVACACARSKNNNAPPEIPPVAVVTEKPQVGTMTQWYRTTADLTSPLESPLSFAIGGRILELTADEGDRVVAGQYLGKVDTTAYAAQYSAAQSGVAMAESQAEAASLAARAAEAQVNTARAALEQAQRDLNRMTSLHDEGVATQAELERAQLGYDTAEQAVQAAEDGAAAARAQADAARQGIGAARDGAAQVAELISNGSLTAPFGGRIAARHSDIGAVVGPGQPIYELIADGDSSANRLEVRYQVTESVVGRIQTGMSLFLDLQSLDQEVPLTVDSIAPSVDPDARTVEMISYIATDSLPLLPGMFGTVRIPIESHDNVIILPERAVIEFEDVKLVYVAEGNTASRREVQVGIRDNGLIEITSGISADDDVIVAGNRFLTDGAAITIREQDQTGASTAGADLTGANQ